MKILWCTHSLAGFAVETEGYNGCGWITSLLNEIKKEREVEVGIAFYYHEDCCPVVRDGVTFFPMRQGHIGVTDKLKSFFGNTSGWLKEENKHIEGLMEVVSEFCPDIIHVWGTETDMGLIAKDVAIPVIIHLQGLLHPYNNILCPPGFSKWDFIRKDGLSPFKMLGNLNALRYWEYKAERETRIFAVCKNYFGRTHWDKAISRMFSPYSNYFYCSEMLRNEFYTDEVWTKPIDGKFRIISTISSPLYKGMDMVLKTAKLLKIYGRFDFEWNIVGISQAKFIEKKIGINADEVNVNLLGVKTAQEIKRLELSSNLYFHPSYIDNSPNSVCEAQVLGMPVIAVNVGGVSSLVENENLIPSNEPHIAASKIIYVYNNNAIYSQNRETASIISRHDKHDIIESLLNGYKKISQC